MAREAVTEKTPDNQDAQLRRTVFKSSAAEGPGGTAAVFVLRAITLTGSAVLTSFSHTGRSSAENGSDCEGRHLSNILTRVDFGFYTYKYKERRESDRTQVYR